MGTVGGFKVERYVDAAGHDCAYYDTTLLFPTNVLDQEGGVNVLDMADPTKPALTARLVTPAMHTPHESLVVSSERGLLAPWPGNLATNVGPDRRLRHLAGLPPPGAELEHAGRLPRPRERHGARRAHVLLGVARGTTLVAVDISNPSLPVPIWFGNYDSHGLSISDDGNRAYVAGINSGLIILDTSQVQARVPNPTMREISRLQWGSMSIPQNAIPITINGHPYAGRDRRVRRPVRGRRRPHHRHRRRDPPAGDLEHAPRGPPARELRRARPTTTGAHNPARATPATTATCPTRVDPGIVACSMILSGLRVFDIRDPAHPHEIAYFNAPVTPRIVPPVDIIPARATGRCRARRSCPSATRSGTRTASAASTRCA